jgi:hypothetical protein
MWKSWQEWAQKVQKSVSFDRGVRLRRIGLEVLVKQVMCCLQSQAHQHRSHGVMKRTRQASSSEITDQLVKQGETWIFQEGVAADGVALRPQGACERVFSI